MVVQSTESSRSSSVLPATPFQPPTGIWSLVYLLLLLEDGWPEATYQKAAADLTGAPSLPGEALKVCYSPDNTQPV